MERPNNPTPMIQIPAQPTTNMCSECAEPIFWIWSYKKGLLAFVRADPKDREVIRPHACPPKSETETTWKTRLTPTRRVRPERVQETRKQLADAISARKRERGEAA